MADEATTTAPDEGAATTATPEVDVEKQAFLERLNKESAKRKDAEKRLAELEARLQEKETEGLPELERERKQREQLEKRLQDAEKAREASEQAIRTARAERWVTAAAKDFTDPDDATRFVDLDGIESMEDAERAVKALAKRKQHLLKREETKLPGRVLENGRREQTDRKGGVDDADAEAAEGFLAAINRIRTPWVGE